MNKLLLIAISVIALYTSCKKDNSSITVETTKQKIQHRWNLVSKKDIYYVGSSTTQIDTIRSFAKPGDYLEFKTNSFVIFKMFNTIDSMTYNIIGDSKVSIEGDTFIINTLTATDFKMTAYYRFTNPVENWDSEFIMNR